MRVDDVDGPVVNAATRTPFEARRRVCVATRDDRLEHSAELVRHQDQVHLRRWLLQRLQQPVRDVVVHRAPEAVFASDRAPALAEQARSRDPRRLREAAERCEDVRQSLEPNVTEDLALAALGFRLAALAGAR